MGEIVRISLSRKQAALVCASLDWVRTQLGFYDDYGATLGKQLGKPHTARMLETFFPEIASQLKEGPK